MTQVTEENEPAALELLLEKIYQASGYDFREYRRGTVMRRLGRRLVATGTKTYLEYLEFLKSHPEEYRRLTDYLTIPVSGFFRSPYTYQQVASLVLPELVSVKRAGEKRGLKFWSTACASGEEPYSMAMLLADFLGNQQTEFDVSIYATDINEKALTQARSAVYSLEQVKDVPQATLESYFTRCDEGYAVSSRIKQMVNFSYLDLVSTTSPPFMNVDCIFCCNILIYLQRQPQERLLNMVYDSLATPGYLILGEVEMPPSDFRDKLKRLDSKAQIYQKNVRTN